MITVENGDAAGHRVKSGSVRVNGREVFGNKELCGRSALLRRAVTLGGGEGEILILLSLQ